MFGVRPSCKITSKSHCNRARDDLRETSGDDDFRGRNGGSEACRQGEWNGKAVRHSDYDIPNGISRSEMLFHMWCRGHRRILLIRLIKLRLCVRCTRPSESFGIWFATQASEIFGCIFGSLGATMKSCWSPVDVFGGCSEVLPQLSATKC